LIATGIGCTARIWAPTVKKLYDLHDAPNAPVHILSIWIIDRPNHDDAGVLNRDILNKEYARFFSNAEYGAAIAELMNSGLLSAEEKANLVGLSHSGGAAALMEAFPPSSPCPYKFMVMVEPFFIEGSPQNVAVFKIFQDRVWRSNAKVKDSWASTEEAMAYLTRIMPWQTFDSECRQIMAETFFTPAEGPEGGNGGRVMAKTTAAQRSATFVDAESAYAGTVRVAALLDASVPVYAIFAEKQDLWPKPIASAIEDMTKKLQKKGLEISVAQGVGHHVPHENAEVAATAIYRMLSKFGVQNARL